MSQLKSILVASDLSPRADYALARAVQLAAQQHATLCVLHVVESLRPQSFAEDWLWPTKELPGQVERALRRDAEAELSRRLAALQGDARLETQVATRVGTPFVEIILHARDVGAELVVVGAHGRAYVRDVLLGTTAEHVVRKGDRPVLLVKKSGGEPYHRVLATVDFSQPARDAVRLALRLVPRGRVELLHAYEMWYEGKLRTGGMSGEEILALHQQYEQTTRTELETFARDCGLNPQQVHIAVRHGYPAAVITRAVAEQQIDLVAVGTRGLTGLQHVLLGSVAEHVLREAASDVLVARPRKTEFALP